MLIHFCGAAQVRLRVQQDKGQVHFTLADAPTKRVRHNLVPRWHFDMLLDDQRNGAYEAAITSAVNEALGKQDGPHHENKKASTCRNMLITAYCRS